MTDTHGRFDFFDFFFKFETCFVFNGYYYMSKSPASCAAVMPQGIMGGDNLSFLDRSSCICRL